MEKGTRAIAAIQALAGLQFVLYHEPQIQDDVAGRGLRFLRWCTLSGALFPVQSKNTNKLFSTRILSTSLMSLLTLNSVSWECWMQGGMVGPFLTQFFHLLLFLVLILSGTAAGPTQVGTLFNIKHGINH
jgi:hypothetical protein